MKQCIECKETKSLDAFPRAPKVKSGYRNKCKVCVAIYMREYLEKNPDKAQQNREKQKLRDRTKNRFKRHNTTEEAHTTLLAKYDGMCWSCKDRVATVIDHDHACCSGAYSCGYCIRGVLCSQCNTALGLLKDSRYYIENLLEYLTTAPITQSG